MVMVVVATSPDGFARVAAAALDILPGVLLMSVIIFSVIFTVLPERVDISLRTATTSSPAFRPVILVINCWAFARMPLYPSRTKLTFEISCRFWISAAGAAKVALTRAREVKTEKRMIGFFNERL